MDKKMEEYLENIALPENESPRHQRELRQKLFDKMERRQQMAFQKRPLRIVYVLAALACISTLAIAGGIMHRKFQLWGKVDGTYILTTAPENTEIDKDGNAVVHGGSIAELSATDHSEDDAKRYAEHLDELTSLMQQNKGELIRVLEIEVGDDVGRTYNYKYVLSDGSEPTMGQGGGYSSEGIREILGEAVQLRILEGKGELIGTKEEEVKGKVFAFEKYKLTLNDGREAILSIGVPKEE